jgi:hypothetical protein
MVVYVHETLNRRLQVGEALDDEDVLEATMGGPYFG